MLQPTLRWRCWLRLLLLFFSVALLNACGGGGGASTPELADNVPTLTAPVLSVSPGYRRLTVFWSAVATAQRYRLIWGANPDLTAENGLVIENAESGQLLENLNNGQVYYLFVQALNDAGIASSTLVSGTPQGLLIEGLFTDANLQYCVDALAASNQWIYADQVSGRLECAFRSIGNLAGLEHFTAVEELVLAHNRISDVSAVGTLFGLRRLDLSHNLLGSPLPLIQNPWALFTRMESLKLNGNTALDCIELSSLKAQLGALLDDIGVAEPGVNCSGTDFGTDSGTGTGSGSDSGSGTGNGSGGDLGGVGQTPGPVNNGGSLQGWPTDVVAISGAGHITVHWRAATVATGYRLYWSTQASVSPTSATLIDGVSSPFVHSGLTNGVTYFYRIYAQNAGVEGLSSAEVSAIPSEQGVPLAGLFPDPALQSCVTSVASTLGWTLAHELYPSLDCSSRGIIDISGMEPLSGLRTLNLLNNAISNLTPLQGANGLQQLILGNNRLQDLQALSGLSGLLSLNISGNQLTGLAGLDTLTVLQQLYAQDNQVVDVSPAQRMLSLRELDLRNNRIGGAGVGNIDGLTALRQVQVIRLQGNPDISCQELQSLVQALGPTKVDISHLIGSVQCGLLPEVPANVHAAGGDGRISVTWEPVLGATTYKVYWSLNPGIRLTATGFISVADTSLVHSGLTNGDTYYYVVTAINAVGEGAASAETSAVAAQVFLQGLFADSSLQSCFDELASLTGWQLAGEVSGSVNCSLRGIQDLSGIEHLTAVSGLLLNENNISNIEKLWSLPGLQILSLRKNSISDARVFGRMNGLRELVLSDNQLANVLPLAHLVNLTQLDLRHNRIGLRETGHVASLTTLSGLTQLLLADNPAMDCTELTSIKAAFSNVLADIQQVEEGINCTRPALLPTAIQAVAGDGRVSLHWQPLPGITDYVVYWSTTPGVSASTGTRVLAGNGLYVHTGLINQTTYHYAVAALRTDGEGPLSNPVSAIPSAAGISLSGLFPDSALTQCVNALAGANGWTLSHEINGTLNCSSRQIVSLQGMDHLPNLATLRLAANQIQDISAVAGLGGLKFIDLYNNQISDISALAGLLGLQRIYLHNNLITDISALTGLTGLTYLILDSNQVASVSPLTNLRGLTHLFLRNNGITDISPLAGLTELSELYINDNAITDVRVLAGLIKLQKLDIRNNQLAGQSAGGIDALANLPNVTQIWLSGNPGLSCTELNALLLALGPSALDVNSAVEGVNCTAP